MTSPMRAPEQHDRFVLLDGSKEWVLPGQASVQVSMASNLDEMQTAGEGDSVTQMNESTCEVEVQLVMWSHEQWEKYQQVLWRLRQGTKAGTAVFTSAHPEVRARRMKRLYFVDEQPSGYNPKDGYKVKLRFKEKLKEKAKPADLGGGALVDPATLGTGVGAAAGGGVAGVTGGTPASTAQGEAMYQSALKNLTGPPGAANGGRNDTADPGYCSAWQRVTGTSAGMPANLYGASAKETEAKHRAAGLSRTWGPDSLRSLQNGDQVFWGNDPSGFGHVGTVVGRDKDGMPLIAGNNLVTYKQRGGRFDAAGRPIDPQIDSRGIVRLDQLSTPRSQPTSYARPGGFASSPAPKQGPVMPLPAGRPSTSVPGPR